MANGKPIDLDADRPPWELQSNETGEAFSRFQFFRDLGPRRKLRDVTDKLYDERMAESAPGMSSVEMQKLFDAIRVVTQTMAGKYHWQSRAMAFDRYEDKKRLEERDREVRESAKKIAKQQLGIGERMAAICVRGLERFLTEVQETPQDKAKVTKRLLKLSVGDLINLSRVGVAHQRQAVGIDDANNREQAREPNDPIPDREKTSRDELKQIAAEAARSAVQEYADDPPEPTRPGDAPDASVTRDVAE